MLVGYEIYRNKDLILDLSFGASNSLPLSKCYMSDIELGGVSFLKFILLYSNCENLNDAVIKRVLNIISITRNKPHEDHPIYNFGCCDTIEEYLHFEVDGGIFYFSLVTENKKLIEFELYKHGKQIENDLLIYSCCNKNIEFEIPNVYAYKAIIEHGFLNLITDYREIGWYSESFNIVDVNLELSQMGSSLWIDGNKNIIYRYTDIASNSIIMDYKNISDIDRDVLKCAIIISRLKVDTSIVICPNIRNIHPRLLNYIYSRMIECANGQTQIFLSSNNTSWIGDDNMRVDSIYYIGAGNNKLDFGSLLEYKDISKLDNRQIYKKFMDGRFGGVPNTHVITLC